jgi:hypothetical protein
VEQGVFDPENFDQQFQSQTDRIVNVSTTFESNNGTLRPGYVVPQVFLGELTGTNFIAEAGIGYDLGNNEFLDTTERIEKGALGISQVAGTLSSGISITRNIPRIWRKPSAPLPPAVVNNVKPTPKPTPNSTPSPIPKCADHGKISNNPQNRLIETGTPRKDGKGWVRRWTRITTEDELRMANDIAEFDRLLDIETDALGLKDGSATLYKFIRMQEFRTKWREDFLQTRNY